MTLIAVPTLSTVPVDFMYSLLNLLATSGSKCKLWCEQNSLVTAARNSLCLRAIEGGYDTILFIDSDMKFDGDALNRCLQTMEEQNADLVSGLFFMRKLPTVPTIAREIIYRTEGEAIHSEAKYYLDYPHDAVFPIAGTGMAFTLIKVDLVKRVIDEFHVPPFHMFPLLGEDYSFCLRAGKLGAKLVCDSRVKIGHIGTYVYDEQTYLGQKGNLNEKEEETVT